MKCCKCVKTVLIIVGVVAAVAGVAAAIWANWEKLMALKDRYCKKNYIEVIEFPNCLLYTSDAADDMQC